MWREDPSTTMVIGWDQMSGSDPIFYYDLIDQGRNINAYRMSKRPDLVVSAKGMNNNFVRLSGLQPNTVYYFIIKDNEGVTMRYSFRTAPDNPGERLSIIAGGDSRNYREARRDANKIVSKLRPHCIMFGGDFTAGDTATEWQEWFDDWQETIGSDGRLFPIIVTRGNHEASNGTLIELFDVKSPDIYYALTLGGDLLRIYTLNTLVPSGGNQGAWLERDLKASANVTWKFAQYHHPMRPHTAIKPDRDELLFNWATLFHQHGVNLAVECDGHVVKSTYPIRPSSEPGSDKGFIRDDEAGTVYVGEGCWGAPLRENNSDKDWTRHSGSFNQFNWIFVDRFKVEVRTVKTDGADNVAEVRHNNIFEQPIGLVVWNPPTGDVVRIHNREVTPVAVKEQHREKEEDLIAAYRPPQTTQPRQALEDWSSAPKINSDPASGLIRFKYTLERTANIEAVLMTPRRQEVSRIVLERQAPGPYLKAMDMSRISSGEYILEVIANGEVIERYRVGKR